ncbi:MAG: lipopolysaccharide assembly protein LapB, partial [Gammaproteobacteria bacterium]
MLELLWLLLPVAAASGWWAARRAGSRPSGTSPPCPDINSEYFRGLNYLLDEQPDKAIEVFIRMVEVDNETVETHLALGNLFRRRGEVDRAIRIHQNLIARPTLDAEQRGQALLELGQDYMRAGLLDRAEGILREVDEKFPAFSLRALRLLLELYQQEKEWDKAIEVARRLERREKGGHAAEIAQFFCERAEAALAAGDLGTAQHYVREALTVEHECARALLLQGRLLLETGQPRQALRALRRIGEQDPLLVAEA